MAQGWTRRAFLAAGALAARAGFAKPRRLPSEFFKYADPSTEFQILRLTDPARAAGLPAPTCRAVSHKGTFLIYWSERNGAPQAYRMDQKTGESVQLTKARALDRRWLALLPDDRSLCYFDGPSLRVVGLGNLRDREVYRVPDGWQRGAGLALLPDGSHAAIVESSNNAARVRLIRIPKGQARTVVEASAPITEPLPRPGREALLYRQGADALYLAGYDGSQARRLSLAPGRTGSAVWSPGGDTLLYLDFPAEPGRLNAIRESNPESGADKLVASTSQFAQFAVNSDASVFVGASGNVASPHVLLLVRASRREMTLCEHRAGDASAVEPVFSPDNRRVYFQTDRHGKSAVYRMEVEKLVEPTEP